MFNTSYIDRRRRLHQFCNLRVGMRADCAGQVPIPNSSDGRRSPNITNRRMHCGVQQTHDRHTTDTRQTHDRHTTDTRQTLVKPTRFARSRIPRYYNITGFLLSSRNMCVLLVSVECLSCVCRVSVECLSSVCRNVPCKMPCACQSHVPPYLGAPTPLTHTVAITLALLVSLAGLGNRIDVCVQILPVCVARCCNFTAQC